MIGIYLIGAVFIILLLVVAFLLLVCLVSYTIDALKKRDLFELFIVFLVWLLIIGVICIALGI